jgi:hypothetical protein
VVGDLGPHGGPLCSADRDHYLSRNAERNPTNPVSAKAGPAHTRA